MMILLILSLSLQTSDVLVDAFGFGVVQRVQRVRHHRNALIPSSSLSSSSSFSSSSPPSSLSSYCHPWRKRRLTGGGRSRRQSRLWASIDDNPSNENPSINIDDIDDIDDTDDDIDDDVELWLIERLPAVPPADMTSYVANLRTLGYATAEQLNSINNNFNEELEFMKKGHRRVILKNIERRRRRLEEEKEEEREEWIVAKDKESAKDRLEGTYETKEIDDNYKDEEDDKEEDKEDDKEDDKEEECLVEEEECWDITRDARFARRESPSLSTTLPPRNSKNSNFATTTTKGGGGGRRGRNVDDDGNNDDYYDDEECLAGRDCWDITVDPRFEKRASRSLATTPPPTNEARGGGSVERRGGGSVVAADAGGATTNDDDDDDDDDDDEYYDITQNLFPDDGDRGRTLFRALTNSRPTATPRISNDAAGASAVSSGRISENGGNSKLPPMTTTTTTTQPSSHATNEKDGETTRSSSNEPGDYYDITRRGFPERRTSGIQPSAFDDRAKSEMNNRKRQHAASALFQRISRKSSPTKTSTPSSWTSSSSNASSSTSSSSTSSSNSSTKSPPPPVKKESYYDITQSSFPERQSSFDAREKSEMNERRSPASARMPEWTAAGSTAKTKKKKATTNATPSIGIDDATDPRTTNRSDGGAAKKTGGAKKTLTNATPSIRDDDDDGSFLDLNSREERSPASSAIGGATRKGGTKPGSFEEGRRRYDDSFRVGDATKRFPMRRPSSSVDTGTEKAGTTDGSYGESKERPGNDNDSNDNNDRASSKRNEDSRYVDIRHFPEDRQSFARRVNSGSNDAGSKERRPTTSASTARDDDEGLLVRNIAQNFSRDQASLHGRSTKKKMINNNNNSNNNNNNSNNAPLVEEEECDDDDICLDTNDFPTDLAPPSPKTATVSSNAVWRADSSAVKHAKYAEGAAREDTPLPDTPRAFAKNLDMVPPSKARVTEADKFLDASPFSFDGAGTKEEGRREPRQSYSATESSASKKKDRRVTEADKYLDTNQFSWNLSPSTAKQFSSQMGGGGSEAVPKKKTTTSKSSATTNDEQLFLDTPRPFRSNVDMVSSNFSGSKFKRSSDIPPEEKNIKDYYDITTAPMPSIDDMADVKVSRTATAKPTKRLSSPFSRKERSDGGGGRRKEDESEYFDITRMSMSKLERTSSVVKDKNNSGFRSRSNAQSPEDGHAFNSMMQSSNREDDGGNVNIDSSEDEESSSYEEVMHWLLTHLPQLQEEDAIAYFNCLLEDGFDSIGMLDELLETDLYFMKKGHQRALLKNSDGEDEGDTVLTEGDDDEETLAEALDDDEEIKSPKKLDDAILRTKAEIKQTEDWIAEQNRLVEKRLAPRLVGEDAADRHDEEEDGEDEPDKDEEEEVYDITKDSFGDRSSLGSDPGHRETPASRERNKHKAKEPRTGTSGSVHVPEDDAVPAPEQTSGNVAIADNASAAPAPRAELYQYYVKGKGLAVSLAQKLKDRYTTWTDDAKSHEVKFTCVFTCPLTGEHFACGSWSNDDAEVVDVGKDGIFWYKNKKQAMNAAAAKALDCFSRRECHGKENAPLAQQRCRDAAYLSEEDAPAIPIPPDGIDLPTILIGPGGDSSSSE